MMRELGLAYSLGKQRGFNQEAIDLYESYLADFDDMTLVQATKAHIRTCQWFPAVSELVELAVLIEQGEPMLPDVAWNLFWQTVRISSWDDDAIKDLPELVKQTVSDLGGVVQFGNADQSKRGFFQAQFRQHYKALVERESRRARMLPETRAYLEMQEQLRLGSGDEAPAEEVVPEEEPEFEFPMSTIDWEKIDHE